jgi:hypothetical protein
MRRIARAVAGATVLVSLAILMAVPVAGASAHRPDGWIRVEGYHSSGTNYPSRGPWHGKNIYNTTARKQKATFDLQGSAIGGSYAYFTIDIQNDGTVSDRFKVHGLKPSWAADSSGVKFFHGSNNVTSAVLTGTFKTTTLSPGSSYQIQVRLLIIGWSTKVVITSVSDSTRSDAVKARYTSTCGC